MVGLGVGELVVAVGADRHQFVAVGLAGEMVTLQAAVVGLAADAADRGVRAEAFEARLTALLGRAEGIVCVHGFTHLSWPYTTIR